MRVFDHPLSPYALKVRAVVYEKGLDVEFREILSEAQRSELLAVNPRAEVPALIDGDTTVYDSSIICDYLEDRFPEPALLPADPTDRATARTIERLSDTQIDGVMIVIGLLEYFRPDMKTTHADAGTKATAALGEYYAMLDGMLADRDYFARTFSRADIALSAHFGSAAFLGHAIPPERTRLTAWFERMNARASITRVTSEALATLGQEPDDPFFDTQRLHWRDGRIEWLIRCGLGAWLLEELDAGRGFIPELP